jgi:hypothetical protein
MRVSLTFIKSAIAASTLAALVGCAMPSWHGFGAKKSDSTSVLANAPPAPSFNPAAPVAPTVTMPPAGQTAGNLPVYPGTNYPVTPYPATAAPSAVVANTAAYPTNPPAATPGYATSTPPGVASDSVGPPAAAAAAVQTPQYAPPQNPPYNASAPPVGTYNAAGQTGTYTR